MSCTLALQGSALYCPSPATPAPRSHPSVSPASLQPIKNLITNGKRKGTLRWVEGRDRETKSKCRQAFWGAFPDSLSVCVRFCGGAKWRGRRSVEEGGKGLRVWGCGTRRFLCFGTESAPLGALMEHVTQPGAKDSVILSEAEDSGVKLAADMSASDSGLKPYRLA